MCQVIIYVLYTYDMRVRMYGLFICIMYMYYIHIIWCMYGRTYIHTLYVLYTHDMRVCMYGLVVFLAGGSSGVGFIPCMYIVCIYAFTHACIHTCINICIHACYMNSGTRLHPPLWPCYTYI